MIEKYAKNIFGWIYLGVDGDYDRAQICQELNDMLDEVEKRALDKKRDAVEYDHKYHSTFSVVRVDDLKAAFTEMREEKKVPPRKRRKRPPMPTGSSGDEE